MGDYTTKMTKASLLAKKAKFGRIIFMSTGRPDSRPCIVYTNKLCTQDAFTPACAVPRILDAAEDVGVSRKQLEPQVAGLCFRKRFSLRATEPPHS